ncbi:hypothetical protein [uncultured Campylobacter sp.]|nr:hypothetical protein [uncultured Campylobacter sp.]
MQNNLRGCIVNFEREKMSENIAQLYEAVLNLTARIPVLTSCLTFAAF